MSFLFYKMKNFFTKGLPNNSISTNDNMNQGDNKCKGNNNNLGSSKVNIDEDKNNIITDTFNYSPIIPFNHMPMLYHNDSFSKSWNGLKLSLNYKPTQFFNLDYMLNIEKNKKLFNNYSLNCSTYIPLSSILFPINLILIGNKESSRAFSFQSHLILGEKDKISIMTNNIPKEINYSDIINNNNLLLINNKSNQNSVQELNNNENNINNIELKEKDTKNELENNYSIEYCHEFNRGNLGIKFTNLEPNTVNFQVSLYKNWFFGMEFFKNPNKEEKNHFLKANYGIMLKQTPLNKLGFTFNYISNLPASIVNLCYNINNNFKIYLNTVFNKNELLKKLGQDKVTASISSYYRNDFIEMDTELNHKGEIKVMSSFSCNKYVDVLMNFCYDHMKKNKRKIKYFGFGLNFKNNSVEEKIEELIKQQKINYVENNKLYNNYNNIMKLK